MDNNNNNQIQNENANENANQNEMKNLEKKVTKNLIKDYSNLLNGNSFKDFSIFVENESNPFEIKVHKSILSSRSPFFNEFLRQESLSISLNQFNKKEMESILKEIIKFIQFKQEKKEIFQFDFFQFLNNWIEKRNERLKGKKEKEKEKEKGIEKKRLFHSFFSLFDKDSISKQDFDKLKQFDFFLPKSFLIHFERTIFEIKDKEKEKKIKENDKRIKEKENKIKEKDKILKQKDEEIQNLKLSFEKKIENQKEKIKEIQNQNQIENKLMKIFSNSEIIKEIEYVKKLQEWINDNKFFSKMKKGFQQKEMDLILKIGIKKSDLQSGYSNFGKSYNLPNGIKYGTDEAKSYLAGSFDEWVVDELETYFI
ncbi:hypothetical protein M0811_05390 [Anaeramoeba ignava]|uniref:BTB domain-containing protein n=1 Tax=Anaeramoeba ignava TaxID=1746090 RepID=A0A9Q0RFE4_ANAIG|nr:hypothetical protein M0811_05390 [Anaeramoeba ignava]